MTAKRVSKKKIWGVGLLAYFLTAIVFIGTYPGVAGTLGLIFGIAVALIYRKRKNANYDKEYQTELLRKREQHERAVVSAQESLKPKVPAPAPEPPITPSAPVPSKREVPQVCPDCKENNPSEAVHCMGCGRKLPQSTCPECETENLPEAKFCMGCGQQR